MAAAVVNRRTPPPLLANDPSRTAPGVPGAMAAWLSFSGRSYRRRLNSALERSACYGCASARPPGANGGKKAPRPSIRALIAPWEFGECRAGAASLALVSSQVRPLGRNTERADARPRAMAT
jgi:hypothetical protein